MKKTINDALNILRSFYDRKLSRELKLLATRIEDDVEQNTARQLDEQTTTIIQAIEKTQIYFLSHDRARALAQEGSLDVLGEALADFILLRTKERFEDGTVIFTNEEQNIPFKLKVHVNPLTKKTNFTFAIIGGSNMEHLNYSRFLKAARAKGRLKIHHLESGNNLLEANCDELGSSEYMERLDSEIAFLGLLDTLFLTLRTQASS